MQFKILVIATVAATVTADGAPYMMVSKPLGLAALAARQEPGYQPEQTICGDGSTCAEACGSGYTDCPSTNGLSHCYNKGAGEICCMDPSGYSCEAGYYCAADTSGTTWCCPDGMSTEECAANYAAGGALQAMTSSSTTNSTSSSSTVVATSTPQLTAAADTRVDGDSGAGKFTASGAIAAIIAGAAALL